ncbi:MAG: ribosome maturation factor RimM [Bermanella sp.]
MNKAPENLTVIGKVTGVYGIKGWVKVFSHTELKESVFSYGDWLLNMNGQWTPVKVSDWRTQGKGLVAQLDGCNDRTLAQKYCQCDIAIPMDALPETAEGEIYYHQLKDLLVVTTDHVVLGQVDHLFNNGANDVLVVKAIKDSIDGRERLLPYSDDCVQSIDLEKGMIEVDWDPEF